jgi:NAD-dependent SIR2 family protein deacetylase
MARHFFGERSAQNEGAKNTCENDKAVLTIAIGASLAVNAAAQVGEQPGETST